MATVVLRDGRTITGTWVSVDKFMSRGTWNRRPSDVLYGPPPKGPVYILYLYSDGRTRVEQHWHGTYIRPKRA